MPNVQSNADRLTLRPGSRPVQPHAQPGRTLPVETVESILRFAWLSISMSDPATRRKLYFILSGVNRTFREISAQLPPVLLVGDEDDLLLHEKMAQAAGYYVCTSRLTTQEDSHAESDEDPCMQLPSRPCPQVHLHLPVSCYHFDSKFALDRKLVLMDSTYRGRLLCVIGACSSIVVHGPLPRPKHKMLENDELTLLGLIDSLQSLESVHLEYTPVWHAHTYHSGLRLPSARYLYLGADNCQEMSRRLCGARLHRAFPNLRHLHLESAEYLIHFAFPPYLSTLSLHVHADADHPTRHAGYAIQSALSREVFRPWRASPVAGRMTIVVKHNLNSAVPLWWEETKNIAEEYGVLLVQTCCAHVCSGRGSADKSRGTHEQPH